jgi:hypothetical protein
MFRLLGGLAPAQLMAVGDSLGQSLGQQSEGSGLDRQFHLHEHGDMLATSDRLKTTQTTYQHDAFGSVLAVSTTNTPYDYAAASG